MAKLTAQELKGYADQWREMGYEGPIRSTEVGGSDYIYRALLRRELQTIYREMPEGTTEQEINAVIISNCVLPVPDLDSEGFGVANTLRDKIEILSGRAVPNPVLAYLNDTVLVTQAGWGEPTDEELAKILKVFEGDSAIQVRKTKVCNHVFVYRSIKGREYAAAEAKGPDEMRGEILRVGVVWPQNPNWDEAPGWADQVIEEKIFRASGYDSEVTISGDIEL